MALKAVKCLIFLGPKCQIRLCIRQSAFSSLLQVVDGVVMGAMSPEGEKYLKHWNRACAKSMTWRGRSIYLSDISSNGPRNLARSDTLIHLSLQMFALRVTTIQEVVEICASNWLLPMPISISDGLSSRCPFHHCGRSESFWCTEWVAVSEFSLDTQNGSTDLVHMAWFLANPYSLKCLVWHEILLWNGWCLKEEVILSEISYLCLKSLFLYRLIRTAGEKKEDNQSISRG